MGCGHSTLLHACLRSRVRARENKSQAPTKKKKKRRSFSLQGSLDSLRRGGKKDDEVKLQDVDSADEDKTPSGKRKNKKKRRSSGGSDASGSRSRSNSFKKDQKNGQPPKLEQTNGVVIQQPRRSDDPNIPLSPENANKEAIPYIDEDIPAKTKQRSDTGQSVDMDEEPDLTYTRPNTLSRADRPPEDRTGDDELEKLSMYDELRSNRLSLLPSEYEMELPEARSPIAQFDEDLPPTPLIQSKEDRTRDSARKEEFETEDLIMLQSLEPVSVVTVEEKVTAEPPSVQQSVDEELHRVSQVSDLEAGVPIGEVRRDCVSVEAKEDASTESPFIGDPGVDESREISAASNKEEKFEDLEAKKVEEIVDTQVNEKPIGHEKYTVESDDEQLSEQERMESPVSVRERSPEPEDQDDLLVLEKEERSPISTEVSLVELQAEETTSGSVEKVVLEESTEENESLPLKGTSEEHQNDIEQENVVEIVEIAPKVEEVQESLIEKEVQAMETIPKEQQEECTERENVQTIKDGSEEKEKGKIQVDPIERDSVDLEVMNEAEDLTEDKMEEITPIEKDADSDQQLFDSDRESSDVEADASEVEAAKSDTEPIESVSQELADLQTTSLVEEDSIDSAVQLENSFDAPSALSRPIAPTPDMASNQEMEESFNQTSSEKSFKTKIESENQNQEVEEPLVESDEKAESAPSAQDATPSEEKDGSRRGSIKAAAGIQSEDEYIQSLEDEFAIHVQNNETCVSPEYKFDDQPEELENKSPQKLGDDTSEDFVNLKKDLKVETPGREAKFTEEQIESPNSAAYIDVDIPQNEEDERKAEAATTIQVRDSMKDEEVDKEIQQESSAESPKNIVLPQLSSEEVDEETLEKSTKELSSLRDEILSDKPVHEAKFFSEEVDFQSELQSVPSKESRDQEQEPEDDSSNNQEEDAAVKIQAAYKGYATRKDFRDRTGKNYSFLPKRTNKVSEDDKENINVSDVVGVGNVITTVIPEVDETEDCSEDVTSADQSQLETIEEGKVMELESQPSISPLEETNAENAMGVPRQNSDDYNRMVLSEVSAYLEGQPKDQETDVTHPDLFQENLINIKKDTELITQEKSEIEDSVDDKVTSQEEGAEAGHSPKLEDEKDISEATETVPSQQDEKEEVADPLEAVETKQVPNDDKDRAPSDVKDENVTEVKITEEEPEKTVIETLDEANVTESAGTMTAVDSASDNEEREGEDLKDQKDMKPAFEEESTDLENAKTEVSDDIAIAPSDMKDGELSEDKVTETEEVETLVQNLDEAVIVEAEGGLATVDATSDNEEGKEEDLEEAGTDLEEKKTEVKTSEATIQETSTSISDDATDTDVLLSSEVTYERTDITKEEKKLNEEMYAQPGPTFSGTEGTGSAPETSNNISQDSTETLEKAQDKTDHRSESNSDSESEEAKPLAVGASAVAAAATAAATVMTMDSEDDQVKDIEQTVEDIEEMPAVKESRSEVAQESGATDSQEPPITASEDQEEMPNLETESQVVKDSEDQDYGEEKVAAATTIQAGFRGYKTRRELHHQEAEEHHEDEEANIEAAEQMDLKDEKPSSAEKSRNDQDETEVSEEKAEVEAASREEEVAEKTDEVENQEAEVENQEAEVEKQGIEASESQEDVVDTKEEPVAVNVVDEAKQQESSSSASSHESSSSSSSDDDEAQEVPKEASEPLDKEEHDLAQERAEVDTIPGDKEDSKEEIQEKAEVTVDVHTTPVDGDEESGAAAEEQQKDGIDVSVEDTANTVEETELRLDSITRDTTDESTEKDVRVDFERERRSSGSSQSICSDDMDQSANDTKQLAKSSDENERQELDSADPQENKQPEEVAKEESKGKDEAKDLVEEIEAEKDSESSESDEENKDNFPKEEKALTDRASMDSGLDSFSPEAPQNQEGGESTVESSLKESAYLDSLLSDTATHQEALKQEDAKSKDSDNSDSKDSDSEDEDNLEKSQTQIESPAMIDTSTKTSAKYDRVETSGGVASDVMASQVAGLDMETEKYEANAEQSVEEEDIQKLPAQLLNESSVHGGTSLMEMEEDHVQLMDIRDEQGVQVQSSMDIAEDLPDSTVSPSHNTEATAEDAKREELVSSEDERPYSNVKKFLEDTYEDMAHRYSAVGESVNIDENTDNCNSSEEKTKPSAQEVEEAYERLTEFLKASRKSSEVVPVEVTENIMEDGEFMQMAEEGKGEESDEDMTIFGTDHQGSTIVTRYKVPNLVNDISDYDEITSFEHIENREEIVDLLETPFKTGFVYGRDHQGSTIVTKALSDEEVIAAENIDSPDDTKKETEYEKDHEGGTFETKVLSDEKTEVEKSVLDLDMQKELLYEKDYQGSAIVSEDLSDEEFETVREPYKKHSNLEETDFFFIPESKSEAEIDETDEYEIPIMGKDYLGNTVVAYYCLNESVKEYKEQEKSEDIDVDSATVMGHDHQGGTFVKLREPLRRQSSVVYDEENDSFVEVNVTMGVDHQGSTFVAHTMDCSETVAELDSDEISESVDQDEEDKERLSPAPLTTLNVCQAVENAFSDSDIDGGVALEETASSEKSDEGYIEREVELLWSGSTQMMVPSEEERAVSRTVSRDSAASSGSNMSANTLEGDLPTTRMEEKTFDHELFSGIRSKEEQIKETSPFVSLVKQDKSDVHLERTDTDQYSNKKQEIPEKRHSVVSYTETLFDEVVPFEQNFALQPDEVQPTERRRKKKKSGQELYFPAANGTKTSHNDDPIKVTVISGQKDSIDYGNDEVGYFQDPFQFSTNPFVSEDFDADDVTYDNETMSFSGQIYQPSEKSNEMSNPLHSDGQTMVPMDPFEMPSPFGTLESANVFDVKDENFACESFTLERSESILSGTQEDIEHVEVKLLKPKDLSSSSSPMMFAASPETESKLEDLYQMNSTANKLLEFGNKAQYSFTMQEDVAEKSQEESQQQDQQGELDVALNRESTSPYKYTSDEESIDGGTKTEAIKSLENALDMLESLPEQHQEVASSQSFFLTESPEENGNFDAGEEQPSSNPFLVENQQAYNPAQHKPLVRVSSNPFKQEETEDSPSQNTDINENISSGESNNPFYNEGDGLLNYADFTKTPTVNQQCLDFLEEYSDQNKNMVVFPDGAVDNENNRTETSHKDFIGYSPSYDLQMDTDEKNPFGTESTLFNLTGSSGIEDSMFQSEQLQPLDSQAEGKNQGYVLQSLWSKMPEIAEGDELKGENSEEPTEKR